MSIHDKIGKELNAMGGHLECAVCGNKQPLGNTARKIANGWPKYCEYTMTWKTQRLIDQEQAYGTDCRNGCDV